MTIHERTTDYGTRYLDCTCDTTAIRIRTQSNGVKIYALQCLDCGRQLRAISKQAPEIIEMPNRLPFDTHLQAQWQARQQQHRATQQAERDGARILEGIEWRARYEAHLKSTAWRMKRQQVLARAKDRCEGCGVHMATQVQHITYEHLGNEFLFELVAVCDDCHRRIHDKG